MTVIPDSLTPPQRYLSSMSCAEVRICNRPTFYPKKLTPIRRTLSTPPYPGLLLPTCSWTILLWASVQDPRPCSRSCSRKFNLNRQRCRLSCSASSASRPESEYWRCQRAKIRASGPMHYPIPSRLLPCGCVSEAMPLSRTTLGILLLGSPLPQGWRPLIKIFRFPSLLERPLYGSKLGGIMGQRVPPKQMRPLINFSCPT